MKTGRFKMLACAAVALAIAGGAALAGNTTLFSSSVGDVVFPFTAPLRDGTAGAIDNMIVGATTPRAGSFTTLSATSGLSGPVAATTLSASSTVSGAGFTARFATPGPIGSTAASTGAFTTFSASGAVSGDGITALFASPPAIGGTAAGAGTFTALTATGAVALSPASANVVISPTGSGVVTLNPAAAGTANNIAIGGSTPLAGTFTTLTATGQIRSTAGAPTIASGACGTTTNGTIAGTNQSGIITIGSATTTVCTVSFSATLAAAPNACSITPASAGAADWATTVARVSSITTGGFVITGSALASTIYYFICL